MCTCRDVIDHGGRLCYIMSDTAFGAKNTASGREADTANVSRSHHRSRDRDMVVKGEEAFINLIRARNSLDQLLIPESN